MHKIAQFFKVSLSEFTEAYHNNIGEASDEEIKKMYDNIKLPKRATTGSAGYDFFLPFDLELKPGEEISIPFGIRAKMEEDWVLQVFPRSGLGRKFRFQLNNTVGIIDSDYFFADNEGHIMTPMANCSFDENKVLKLSAGTAAVQGVFIPYGITVDDEVSEKRTGGFGSTG